MKKLNLGSGEDRKEGYINIDWNKISNPDIVHDLNKFPYPFEDNSFDLIEATHIIEHLDRPFEIMREMHRILKKGGRLKIKVPHFSRGMTHSEHLHGFDVTFPMYFNKKYADMGFSGYYGVDFELIGLKLKWMAFIRMLPSMGYSKITIILVSFLNKFLSFLANLSPNICSRVWCFWVGGFEEIEFVFKK
ncbi:class I SAM-dependent methyltransferase [Candidatus Parcubacteria bacterium]|nr:class I SAM-dependent methyltransferase [Candidatus Parcubacteria bacterium]